MGIVKSDLAVSVDGFVAGTDQNFEFPLGRHADGGAEFLLHSWMFDKPDENQPEVDAIVDAGAFIMGRNMFGPDRGEWDLDWKGWWGDDPPYHGPVFVLGHRPRPAVEMEGGTTFHFVTSFDEAMERAIEAAGDDTVTIAGGASAVRQGFAAGVIDEILISHSPIALGAGESIFEGLADLRLRPVEVHASPNAPHVIYRRA